MSYTLIAPPPPEMSALAPGDLDKSPGADWPSRVAVGGLLFTSVGAPVITRTDGVPIGPNDITVLNIALAGNGLSFGWWFQAGSNTGSYLVDFPVTLSDGSALFRTVTIAVVANVG